MNPTGTNYLAFMTWIGLWSLVMHWFLAATNSCNWLRYVTRFPCDIFGFYVACIYLQKGVQVLEILGDGAPFYMSIMVALLVFMVAFICAKLGESSLFRHPVRIFLKDYGTPLTVIFFTGFTYIGRMESIAIERLPTTASFLPTQDRPWLVRFWEIPVADIFIAIPFAILLTILFWFDHNGMLHIYCKTKGRVLTLKHSVIPHCPGHRVPSAKARRLPLGHLSPRAYYGCGGYLGSPLSQWLDPPGALSHRGTLGDEDCHR